MHFGFFSVALLFGSVIASPVETQLHAKNTLVTDEKNLRTRDTSVIDRYIKRMTDQLTYLKNTIRSLPSGGTQDDANRGAMQLLDLHKRLNNDMRDGAREIRKGPSVNAIEAVVLLTGINSFSNLISDVVLSMTSENVKRMIWTAGKQDAQKRFYSELVAAQDACIAISDAMMGKMPLIDLAAANIIKNSFVSLLEPAVSVRL
jgi:hypothetical protein